MEDSSSQSGEKHQKALERLVVAVQELSLARSVQDVMRIVRRAAREIVGSDGATFILRDGAKCYYADEDAISPLWKGQRFPLADCISGWAMLNRQPAVIEDIYQDPRIPHDAYKPTFVKSLVMVPIRTMDPVGAIGNYWARRRAATAEEVRLIQALADSASVAMENVNVYGELERRVQARTAQLEDLNKELEAFSYSVSHDLRAPLRAIAGYANILLQDFSSGLAPEAQRFLKVIQSNTSDMGQLISDLLDLSRLGRQPLATSAVDMEKLARDVFRRIQEGEPGRALRLEMNHLPAAQGDPGLLRQVWANLLSNAVKYTGPRPQALIEVAGRVENGENIYSVKDNGVGFDANYADKLFKVFQRLHTRQEFEGTGVGLAIVQRVVRRHGGRVWAASILNEGAVFSFSLPATQAGGSSGEAAQQHVLANGE